MDTLWHDIRYGFRTLGRSPGFLAVAVLTLALGIGANTAIFSVVDAALLRPLPYRSPDKLVALFMTESSPGNFPLTGGDFLDWRAQNTTFEDMAVYSYQESFNASGEGDAQRTRVVEIQANFFDMLGVQPAIGRLFRPGEDAEGKNHIALLSYGVWKRQFNGGRSALGKTVQLNGEQYEIVGVIPEWYKLPGGADLWIPIEATLHGLGSRGNHHLRALGRIKDGVTIAQARADMQIVSDRLAKQYPNENSDSHAVLVPLKEQVTGSFRSQLWIIFGAVALVLLIACVNVANLTLARAASRQREIAVRSALGASRGRLIRQLLTESVMLSIAGAVPGIALAYAAVVALRTAPGLPIAQPNPIAVEPAVLLFTLTISVTAGVLFGLAPAWQISRKAVYEELKAGGKMAFTVTASGRVLRDALVAVEIALSLVLLAGAGLLLRTFQNLRNVNIGVQAEKVLTAAIYLPVTRYDNLDPQSAFFARLHEALAGKPGITGAAFATELPVTGGSNGYLRLPGETSQSRSLVEWDAVSPDYFRVMGIPLIAGRALNDADAAYRLDASRRLSAIKGDTKAAEATYEYAAVINQSMAKKYWPNKDALGQEFFSGGNTPNRIVGIVGDTKTSSLTAPNMPQAYFSLPWAMGNHGMSMDIAVAGEGRPEALANSIRDAVRGVDSGIAVYHVTSMPDIVAESMTGTSFQTFLLGIFAGLALLLASVGIYGVLSYVVTQRTNEIGIRMALGAGRGNVLWMVMRQGLALIAIGIGVGVAGTYALTGLMQTLLYGVKPTDPATFIGVSVLMAVVAMSACMIPAWRATRVDPMIALRYE
jgi:predicted permease